jgi:hypothetical protein
MRKIKAMKETWGSLSFCGGLVLEEAAYRM